MEITGTVGQIVVNGESREVPVDVTIDDLLSHLGRDPEMPGVAVAVNDTVVRRANWTKTMLKEGDHVEIITASQGG
ncbi:MAG: sulfur carrier protein ThiS [Bacteroidetes bacterium]|nr:sulfur carrier protein ThiS [Bacteroidota bacterium]